MGLKNSKRLRGSARQFIIAQPYVQLFVQRKEEEDLAEYHHFQAYGNGKYADAKGLSVCEVVKNNWDTPSAAQMEYHKALLSFMESKGLNTIRFKRFRNRRELRSKISGMLTIIRKAGLAEEFFGEDRDAESKVG